MATVRITSDMTIDNAASILLKTKDISEYESILKTILAAGYNINAYEGMLLFTAFREDDIEKINLLFKSGAHIHIGTRLLGSSSAFTVNTVRSKEGAHALADYVLSLPADTLSIIRQNVHDIQSRIDVFDYMLCDPACEDKLTKLYIALGSLPVNDNVPHAVRIACGRYNVYAKNTKEFVKYTTQQEDYLEEKEHELSEYADQINDLTEKLAKANALIAKLSAV